MKLLLVIFVILAHITISHGYGVYSIVQHSPSICPSNSQDFLDSIYFFGVGYIDECVWIAPSGTSYFSSSWMKIDGATGEFNTTFDYYLMKSGTSVCESMLLLQKQNFSSEAVYDCSVALNSEAFSISVAPDIRRGIEKLQNAGVTNITENTETIGVYLDSKCQTPPRFLSIAKMSQNCTAQATAPPSNGCYPTSHGYYAKRACFSEITANVTVTQQTSDSDRAQNFGILFILFTWLMCYLMKIQ